MQAVIEEHLFTPDVKVNKIPSDVNLRTKYGSMPNKNLGVDHAFDAFGYLCLQQFNLAKPETLGQTSFRIY